MLGVLKFLVETRVVSEDALDAVLLGNAGKLIVEIAMPVKNKAERTSRNRKVLAEVGEHVGKKDTLALNGVSSTAKCTPRAARRRLLALEPDHRLVVVSGFDRDDARPAAHGAVLDVALMLPRSRIHEDLRRLSAPRTTQPRFFRPTHHCEPA